MTGDARLNAQVLDQLPAEVRLPRYERKTVGIGIVHLGIGAFHRAHQAVYTDRAIELAGGDWAICGVSLRSAAVRERLVPQEGLYTVATRHAQGADIEVIAAVREVLVAPEVPDEVMARIAAPQTQVVTLTITEKGYCLNPADGRLDLSHPDISHDLENPTAPRSAIGFLVGGLARRRSARLPGITLLSCDNLTGNSQRLRQAVLEFASTVEPGLDEWIATACRFPCSMVDRIVPATTEADLAEVATLLGMVDQAPVLTEPFSQWVIEDDFAGPRPDWAAAGAELVADVSPFEEMKLRLLNASHSALAYLGNLAGHETVAETLAAPGFKALLRRLMAEEMAPTLEGLGDFDIDAYQSELLARFANPALRHQTRQIAMDGSQKIAQRLLPAIGERLARGQDSPLAVLAVAAWMRHCEGVSDGGEHFEIDDPLADRLSLLRQSASSDGDWLDALLGMESVFPAHLAGNARFRTLLGQQYGRLREQGAAKVVAAFAA